MYTVVRKRTDGTGHLFETDFDSELDALIFARCQSHVYWDPWKWMIEVYHDGLRIWDNWGGSP